MNADLAYHCENPDCRRYNLSVYLGSEYGEALCRWCGWMLHADYAD